MQILLICHSFNSLSQRVFVELTQQGHSVSVEFDINDEISIDAVALAKPDLIIAPFLKRAIPAQIWQKHLCWIIHPGIPGDRGPSALDWAILKNKKEWGVTIIQANNVMDGGDIWAYKNFQMPESCSKANLYRHQVSQAAIEALNLALSRLTNPDFKPQTLDYDQDFITGNEHKLVTQQHRQINWSKDSSELIKRKIQSGDGFPGVLSSFYQRDFFLYDVRDEKKLQGKAGEIIAKSETAICVATRDGAFWIGHLREKNNPFPFKLPAVMLLQGELDSLDTTLCASEDTGYLEINFVQYGQIGYLYFDFYNGAMSTKQCQDLLKALIEAKNKQVKIIVLMGGKDFWSNGMNLNVIEAAESAADESWNNINAMDDLAKEIILTEEQIIISAIQGNTAAGGVFLARAADQVWAKQGVILNPHYKDMGNLYGSEYWTYLLAKYTGEENAQRISQARLPMGVDEAKQLGLVNKLIQTDEQSFEEIVQQYAEKLLASYNFNQLLLDKKIQRKIDEENKALATYRTEELQKMKQNFYGFDPSYHVARYNFVYKVLKSRTPITIALHRNKTAQK
jgi:putative two-component system protein, hydrogenase maturation factor HypX/HoxX